MRELVVRFVILSIAAVAGGAGGGAGCGATPIGTPPPPRDPCRDVACIRAPSVYGKVDLLFVLDDAPSMGPKLTAWRATLPKLVAMLDGPTVGAPVHYHLGVVTADLGAGPDPIPALGCHRGGDGAILRRFIDHDQILRSSNVPDVTAALLELSDVGTGGCEFRAPLEAAYRALHDTHNNAGFLRADALLVVVFVTDADDCSAPFYSDLFDGSPAGVAKYGPLDRFRCAQFGIACNGMPLPPTPFGPGAACYPQPMSAGGQLLDISRYVSFFTLPAAQGGVKVDPDDLILLGVAAPPDPLQVIVTSPCAADASTASCPQLQPSCVSLAGPVMAGVPSVRLSAVLSAARNHALDSVCNATYDDVVQTLSTFLARHVTRGCLHAAVAARADGTPDCTVEDVTAHPDGSTSITELASCAQNGHVTPCWQLVDHFAEYQAEGCVPPPGPAPASCRLSLSCQPVIDPIDGRQEIYSVEIDRGRDSAGNPLQPPANTTARVSCATIPTP